MNKNKRNPLDSYFKYYKDIEFTRSGLFQAVADEYDVEIVLYPGCSFHITPAIYLPHMVFVDKSDAAKKFFSEKDSIQDYVNGNKKYKRSSYIQYLHSDFTEELPLRNDEFDLLISLFAGGIIEACIRYIKPGGIILTNNYQEDMQPGIKDSTTTLDAIVYKKGKKYVIDRELAKEVVPGKRTGPARYLRNRPGGMEYVEHERYYVLKKVSNG